jgi:hypothetical protein
MGNLNGGFNSNEYKGNLFPEGRFQFYIHSSELVPAKKNEQVIGTDWEFKLICMTNPHMNKPFSRKLAFERSDKSPNVQQQLQIAKAQIGDICRAVNVLTPNDTKELNGKKFEADVKIKGDFNNLAKIKPILGGGTMPTPAAPPEKNMVEQAFEGEAPVTQNPWK